MDYKWDLGKFPMGYQDLDIFRFLLLFFGSLKPCLTLVQCRWGWQKNAFLPMLQLFAQAAATTPGRHGSSPGPARAAASALGPALALRKQLPAGFTESFSKFQVLQGRGCAGLVQINLWAGATGRAPAPGPRCSGPRRGAEPSGVWGGAGPARPEEAPCLQRGLRGSWGAAFPCPAGKCPAHLKHLVLDSQAEQDSWLALG